MCKLIPIILFGLFFLLSCSTKKSLTTATEDKSPPINFPLDWIGHYEGKLSIYATNGDPNVVSMQLIINYPDAEGYFPWTVIYDEKDVRRYGLEVINTDRGLYRINEYNSIELDAYLIDRHLISRFSVMQNDLIIDYEHVGDAIIAQFFISSIGSQNITGGEIIGQDTIPKVKTYPIQVYQKAVLKKKD
jgi:hypothetical protein